MLSSNQHKGGIIWYKYNSCTADMPCWQLVSLQLTMNSFHRAMVDYHWQQSQHAVLKGMHMHCNAAQSLTAPAQWCTKQPWHQHLMHALQGNLLC